MEIPISSTQPELSHRGERALKDNASPKTEDKSTQGFYIPEADRLIKNGLYKKAFNLMEKHMLETENIPTILRIRLCRRIVACLTKICGNYLMKGDIQHVDRFIKLLEKSNNFLFLWHELLRIYVTKTNPKFAHLHGMLGDISDASEEELEAMNLSKSRKSSQYIDGSFESADDTGDQKASMFNKRLKKQKGQNSRNRDHDLIENTFNFLGGPTLKMEEFDGTEVNISFFLDDFLKYLLSSILNWSMFFKKVMKKYQAAYRFLTFCDKLSKDAEASLNPDLLNIVAKVKLTMAVFNSEFGRNTEAMIILESALKILQVEISLRINRSKEKLKPNVFTAKLQKTIRLLVFVFINMSMIYEQQESYQRVLESLKLGCWFATKFLTSNDEVFKAVITLYDTSVRKFDKYIKELGEIERIVNGGNDVIDNEFRKMPNTTDHFTKINEYLYKKFHYDQLNAGQFVVVVSPPKTSKAGRNPYRRESNYAGAEDDYGDHNERGSERSNYRSAPLKSDWYADASMAKSNANEPDSQHDRASLRLTLSNSKAANVKDRRKKKLKKNLNISVEEIQNKIMSERYRKDIDPEREVNELHINQEDEDKYIAMLNKNIKRAHGKQVKRPKTSDPRKGGDDAAMVDIDGYFKKALESEIKDREQELRIHPTEFKRIVKNYAYFLKNEDFDKKELTFANKVLASKARENLGDVAHQTKYKSPTFKIAEKNNVKMEAYYYEVKVNVENKIAQRNSTLKSAKQMMSKSLKSFSRMDTREKKLLLQDSPTLSEPAFHKPNFTTEVRNHKASVLNHGSPLVKKSSSPHLANIGGMVPKSALNRHSMLSASHKGLPMTLSDGFHSSGEPYTCQNAKDAIQLMMESIEKNIEEEDVIAKRIEDNRPQVERFKPKEKFLKIPGELARSTSQYSEKKDAKQKSWNLNELYKGDSRPDGLKAK